METNKMYNGLTEAEQKEAVETIGATAAIADAMSEMHEEE
jgi:hypothetical protein